MIKPRNPSRIDQIWNEQQFKLKLKFAKLNDSDFYFETGRKHEMMERIGIKLGKSYQEIERIFQSL